MFIIAVLVAIAVALISVIAIDVIQSRDENQEASETAAVVRDNSHVLDDAGDEVVLVEFLDFECEACAAFYPYVEQARADYAGEVTFVTRYFPIPGHQNSRTAAIAVEAAAQQGHFEQMYQLMFENQKAWGERQDSQAGVFRGYAEALGLDLDAYDAAVADPATLERVLEDYNEGIALGVNKTPTFFLNGEKMEIQSIEDFRDQLDAAIAARQ